MLFRLLPCLSTGCRIWGKLASFKTVPNRIFIFQLQHTHTRQNASHLVFILCFVIYAFYVTEVVDQFLQHFSVYFCNTVYLTHTSHHLKQLNSCDRVIRAYGTRQPEKRPSCTNWSPLMCTVSKSAPFPAMWTSPLQHRHVFCLLSSANQKPVVNFNNSTYLKLTQNKLRSQDSTLRVETGLLAGISKFNSK